MQIKQCSKFRVAINTSKKLSFSIARSLYISHLQALACKGSMVIYHNNPNTFCNEHNLTKILKLLEWMQIHSNFTSKNIGRSARLAVNLAEKLVKENKAYQVNNEIKLYKNQDIIGKTSKNIVNDKHYYITKQQVNQIGNLLLVDSRGCPTKWLLNVLGDYMCSTDYVLTDTYFCLDVAKESMIRLHLGFPIVKYGFFGSFIFYDKTYLEQSDYLNIIDFKNKNSDFGPTLNQFLLQSCWQPKVLFKGFTPSWTKEYLISSMNTTGMFKLKDTHYEEKELFKLHKDLSSQDFQLTS